MHYPTSMTRPFFYRYYAFVKDIDWPPEVRVYNEKFTKLIEGIKRRHDPVVTTVVCNLSYYMIHDIVYIYHIL